MLCQPGAARPWLCRIARIHVHGPVCTNSGRESSSPHNDCLGGEKIIASRILQRSSRRDHHCSNRTARQRAFGKNAGSTKKGGGAKKRHDYTRNQTFIHAKRREAARAYNGYVQSREGTAVRTVRDAKMSGQSRIHSETKSGTDSIGRHEDNEQATTTRS